MKHSKQLSFYNASKKFHGGALLAGKRKSLRPLTSKDSIHFVLRSAWATKQNSFLTPRNRREINFLIDHFAKKFGVRVYERAINSNHIHLLLKITNRTLYRAFIRALSGKIASHVMNYQSFETFKRFKIQNEGGDGSLNLQKAHKEQAFWEYRPFSRIVNWGRDYKNCLAYLKKNLLEALGFIPYTERENYYARYLAKIQGTS